MDRNDGEQPSCRDKGISYLPPMTPLSSAATMRSLHSEASTHDHYGPFVSAPCLTLTGTSGATLCSRCGSHASTFLPPFPRRDFAFRAFSGSPPQRYYGDSDSCTAHLPCRSPRLPRHTFLSFRLQPRELPGHRLTPRQRDQRFSGFAHGIAGSPQLSAESSSSSYGPTVRLRLLSTPPRGDAVTFGYGAVAYSGTDFHRADVAPLRAHSPPNA